MIGTRPWTLRDRSTNFWPLAIATLGESRHNLHHADPTCARHGVGRGQLDIAAAGASALWHRANDGMVNGVVTWAVTVIALLGIALVGGGALVGSLADTATQFVNLRAASAGVDIAEATRTAQQTAGATALGLGLSMLAAALGGSVGAKLWPGHGDRDAHNR
jgi:hypothetical protein